MKRFIVFFLLFSLLIAPFAVAQDSVEYRIDGIAALAFGDDLITSHSGKFPTVSFRASCGSTSVPLNSKEDLIYDANTKLMKFMDLFQEFCKNSGYVYNDLRINIFMRFFNSTGLGTTDGEILSFNIYPETVLTLDFKSATIADLLNVGFNIYAHPLMQ